MVYRGSFLLLLFFDRPECRMIRLVESERRNEVAEAGSDKKMCDLAKGVGWCGKRIPTGQTKTPLTLLVGVVPPVRRASLDVGVGAGARTGRGGSYAGWNCAEGIVLIKTQGGRRHRVLL